MVVIITCDIDQFVIKRLITKCHKLLSSKHHKLLSSAWYKYSKLDSGVVLYLQRKSFFPKEIYNMVFLIELAVYMNYHVSRRVINFRKLESFTLNSCNKTHIDFLKLPNLNDILVCNRNKGCTYQDTKSCQRQFVEDLRYLMNKCF